MVCVADFGESRALSSFLALVSQLSALNPQLMTKPLLTKWPVFIRGLAWTTYHQLDEVSQGRCQLKR